MLERTHPFQQHYSPIKKELTRNILVLVILALYENLKSLTNIFILNLAISDLIFTTGLPFWAIYHIWGYLAVVHPLSDLRIQKLTTGIFLSLLMWMISIGAAIPSLLYSSVISIPHKDKHSRGCEYESTLWKSIAVSQQNIFFLVAFVVIGFCYIRILGKISQTRSHTKNRAVKLVLCIVAVFFIGWVPYNLVIFLRTLDDNLVPPFDDCEFSIQLDYAFHVCRLIAFSHCCLNPVFYVFVGVKFRSHLKSMLQQIFSRKSAVEEPQITIHDVAAAAALDLWRIRQRDPGKKSIHSGALLSVFLEVT
ncbi:unnamed protein product [Pleuronectes platessa]|uniref:G-protein coupled receptors family 1 profile domain-containing protein n=1 Tax=Pleuronectes platessa TaxID=8262 RepID=A0A9N7V2X3_PLEPL|nr:unnamed protein product [Pleuronectes platessa]